ncbi:MAG: YeeE/YedE family protein [Burkholderiaceae bacterium]
MPDIDPLVITRHVLWLAFAFGGLFGVVAQRTHFCTMGAVADIVSMGDWARMRMWVLAIAVAVLGFNAMVGLGWVQAGQTLYATPRMAWLSLLVGGALFGFGMVIASGCGSRNLVRLGGGNLKSLVVLVVLGLSGFATLKGITGSLRVATVDRVVATWPKGQDLPSLLAAATGTEVPALAWWLGTAIAALLVAWVLWRPEGRRATVWLGGLGVGAVVVGLWWVSGTAGHLAEDPRTLEEAFLATNSHRMESLSTVAPIAYGLDWLLYYSDASQTLSFGIVTMLGIVLGAAASALASRSFRLEGFGNAGDLAHHLVGATLMGVGGVTALGCSIGQGLSGVSTLSIGSMLALAAILAGTWLGLRYQEWRL